MTYWNINIQVYIVKFCCRSANSLSFRKYYSFSPKIGGEENCQNPFPVILRLKKGGKKFWGVFKLEVGGVEIF